MELHSPTPSKSSKAAKPVVQALLETHADPTTPARAGQLAGKHPLDLARLVGMHCALYGCLDHLPPRPCGPPVHPTTQEGLLTD